MLTVGVTGGIGAGKSTVSARLAELGAVVIDSDRLARDVVAPGTPGLAAVTAEFGPGVLGGDGALDRAELARIVFADAGARHRLEAITHPMVRAAFLAARDAAGPDTIVVNDIPLVRTLSDAARFHLVITVAADEAVRLRRLVDRGLDREDAAARMAAQVTDPQRRALSDVWLRNDGDEAALRRQVDACWSDRLVPMAANVAARRQAPRPRPVLVDHDPTWADQAALLCARLSAAAGGLRCEHIGATAVPGLPADLVIDLQLAVPDLGAADAVADDLADAAFPRVAGVDRDHPHPRGDESAGWGKRLHANADPGLAVNLHVRVRGAANWRWALLLRDWLRAEPAGRAAYLAAKRQADAQDDDAGGHAAAEEAWLAAAGPRTESWAARTGWTPAAAPRPDPRR